MRWVLSLLLLYVGHLPAHELAPLRFSITDSWTLPLLRIENNQPVEGIMLDLMSTLASRVQRRPEYFVMPRLRLHRAMERNSVDVRCYVMPSWVSGLSDKFSWSVPLLQQRDLLVSVNQTSTPTNLAQLPSQVIGTVLGFHYPTLQPLFDNGHFERDDARSQLQVLQKLQAGRYRYAVTSQMSLDWFNRLLPETQRVKAVALLEEQALSCYVRNDPGVPTQRILNALQAMKTTGEIEQMVKRHTASLESQNHIGITAH